MNEKIYYNEDLPEGVEPLYNGNIADVYYSAHDSAHFRLSYDGLNRLTASQQYTRDGVKTAAAEAFSYDKMGNITSIVRSTQNPQPDYINRVQLFYDGNRIIRGEGSPYSGGYNDMVYPNLVGKDVEYEYDPNGNLIKNSDNRISLTTYNLLNLPQTVAFSDKSLSVFYYMADGRKIRNATGAYSISTAVPIDSVVKNTDPYISYMSEWNDEFWYQGKLQKYINTPEGNIEVSTGRKMSFSYCYTSKDHLGSIWLYWNSLSNKYSNIYYPSGIMREKRRSPYNYGLTGKEIVYDNGLDEYFFGARTLFAPINRFNQPDPLCEEYYHISPYAYCANNFINALDPDGRDSYLLIWFSNNNETGHAGIAIDNYKQQQITDNKGNPILDSKGNPSYNLIKDGTMTYYDLWPNNPVRKTELQSNVKPDYSKGIIINSLADLIAKDPTNSRNGNVSAEGRAVDGIVQIITTYTQDKKIQGYASNTANSGKAYNASNFNCSTFVENALKTVFPTLNASQYIKIPFPLNVMYKDTKVIAPNNLYNATMKLPNAINIKGPKSVIAKPYLEYYGK